MLGKKSSERRAKKTFFIFTRISVPKMGLNIRAKQFFQKHTNSASGKYLKKSSENSGKNGFLYSYEYRDQKMRGR